MSEPSARLSQQDRISDVALSIAETMKLDLPTDLIRSIVEIQVKQQFSDSRTVALSTIRDLVGTFVEQRLTKGSGA